MRGSSRLEEGVRRYHGEGEGWCIAGRLLAIPWLWRSPRPVAPEPAGSWSSASILLSP